MTEEIELEATAENPEGGDGDGVQAAAEPQTDGGDETTTMDPVAELELALSEARQQAEENLDGWQRALADFSNYKKRIEREQAVVYQNALGKAIRHYLEIMDDLELALKNRPQGGEGAGWAEGVDLILRKLQGFLVAEGVTAIEAEGKMFDPNLHEAITMEPSEDHESGQVISVVQTGYLLGERVLRPAKVRVAQ